MNMLNELYQAACTDGAQGEPARQLLDQTHWFTVNAEFDPKTGKALPQALSMFLAKVSEPKPHNITQDRLYRITEHARLAVERLLRSLNESPRREHALLAVHAVRELDAGSFIKLSKRPGRTIREKLAGKPYLHAVRRVQSVNLPENRLLKDCVSRLSELLRLRSDILGEPEDELLPKIESWLLSDEARSIGAWDNLPPNNTLLAHRDYRRVWDTWRRLQSLDDDIERDRNRLDERSGTMRRWINYGGLYREGTHLFADMPVLFDYDKFSIQTWTTEPKWRNAPQRVGRSKGQRIIDTAVCLDLTALRPLFATGTGGWQVLSETYLWQQWKNSSEPVDIALFAADVACLHPEASTITSQELFFASDRIDNHLLERAARAFACRLRETFKDDRLYWLVPDAINDFDLEAVRRNLNARFPSAEPLPRSIAALFEQIDYARIRGDDYPVVVVDTIGGIICATKLIAKFDANLKKVIPETNGYYWERCPPIILSRLEDRDTRRYDMITVDEEGNWHDRARCEEPRVIDAKRLKNDKRIGPFKDFINLSSSPVVGGMRLHALQSRAGDIPIWRDQIPELSIKVMKGGRLHRFYLVSRETPPIKPTRGVSVPIPIKDRFTLPAGRSFYQFPLSQGENAAELRFSARLDSPAFPLKADTDCELSLTFEYGANEPYCLVFAPVDKSFPPVRATWKHTVEEIITDAPAPSYPPPLSWDDLRRMPKLDSNETSDLLEWVISAIDRLDRDLVVKLNPRVVGKLTTKWDSDRNNEYYAFAKCVEVNERIILHQRSFVKGFTHGMFHTGDLVSFKIQKGNGGCFGYEIAPVDYIETNDDAANGLIRDIRKRLYFPIIQVWRDGRSISDNQCPSDFALMAAKGIEYLSNLVEVDEIPQSVKMELLFILACIHKDTTDECVRWINEQVETGSIRDARAVGFALGDVSQEWQKYIFNQLATSPRSATLSVFAYAIWREQRFLNYFTLAELKILLEVLLQRMHDLIQPSKKHDKREGRNRVRATIESLELLLGLLRTRASDNADVRMLLQPHQKITKEFAEQVEHIEQLFAEKHIALFSRVQINIQKPEGVLTPDLLYALRLYLTGDDGANAIHITGISDNDTDNDEK